MNPQDLINWGELSMLLSGSRMTIRKNKVPKVHQPIVDKLLSAIDGILSNVFAMYQFKERISKK